MSIYLVRHADKLPGDFYSDHLPLNNQPISEKGKKQAQALVKYFQRIDVDSIIVSEYIRTGQTISYVAESKKLSFSIDKRLNEINIGDLEKLSDEEVGRKYPEFWQKFMDRTSDFTFPNGESGDAAGARFYELFCSLDHDKNHVLVAHDGIIRTLICKVLTLPTYKRHLFRVDYSSITVFDYNTQFNCWIIPQINSLVH